MLYKNTSPAQQQHHNNSIYKQCRFWAYVKRLHIVSYVTQYTSQTKQSIFRTYSLELHRLSADLNLLYKIISGMCGIDLNSLLSLCSDATTRGHQHKIIQEHCTSSHHRNFFMQCVAPIWNSLPPSIVDFSYFARFRCSFNMLISVFSPVFNCSCFYVLVPSKWYFLFPSVTCVD